MTGIGRLLASALALFPVAMIAFYVVVRSRGRTSLELINISLLLGACVALLAVGVEVTMAWALQAIPNLYIRAFMDAFGVAAIPEEGCKFLVLVYVVMRHEDCLRPSDVLISAICVGLGFAGLENLFYIVGEEDWQAIGALRALSAVPGHAIFGMVLGFFASRAFEHPEGQKTYLAKGLVAAIVLHGLYDFPLFVIEYLESEGGNSVAAASHFALFVVVLLVGGVIGIRCMEAVLDDRDVEGVDYPETPSSRLFRRLISQRACKAFGLLSLLVGATAIAFTLYTADETGSPSYALFPLSIFLIIFGCFMVRFGFRNVEGVR